MQDPYNSQQSPYQADPSGQSMTPPPPPPSGQPYQPAPSYPTYPQQQHTTYPPQPPSAYPVQPSQPYPTAAPQAYPATTPAPYPPYGTLPPQPPRKSNTTLLAVIGVIVAILIVGVGVIVAVSRSSANSPTVQVNSTPNSQPTNSATQSSQPTTLPTNSASGNHKVGDKVSLDGYTIVVNSVKTTPGGQYDTPQHAGDIYLEIDVSITNQTGKAQSFDSMESFTLKDSTGQQYDQTILLDAPSSPDGTIQNGGTLRGTMPYEIAPSMKSFELDFSPDPFENTDQATWNLSVS